MMPTQNGHVRTQLLRLREDLGRFGVGTRPDYIRIDVPHGVDTVVEARARLVRLLREDPRIPEIENLGQSELESLRFELVRLCVEARLQQHLADADIPYPIYNFFASFEENSEGPWDRVAVPPEAVMPANWRLMGFPVRFPIGVPASGLTANAQWIKYFARQGFNIITYKTVRSHAHEPHRYPHWVFLQDIEPWRSLDDVGTVRGDLGTWPKDLSRFSTANSFGVPSLAPADWQPDVERALTVLASGQVLIVSVMGSTQSDRGISMIDDFVEVARLAEATGVRAIELNLSCPNTASVDKPTGMEPPICSDPEVTRDVVQAVRAGLRSKDTRLVAKLGYVSAEALEQIVSLVGRDVDALSGINTVQAPVRMSDDDDASPFRGTADDPERERDKAGVSGQAIRELGLDFVTRLAGFRAAGEHQFAIIGMGGVMSVEDVDAYLRAGANAVQSATGACLSPDLPLQVVGGSELVHRAPARKPTRLGRFLNALTSGGYSLVPDRGEQQR